MVGNVIKPDYFGSAPHKCFQLGILLVGESPADGNQYYDGDLASTSDREMLFNVVQKSNSEREYPEAAMRIRYCYCSRKQATLDEWKVVFHQHGPRARLEKRCCE